MENRVAKILFLCGVAILILLTLSAIIKVPVTLLSIVTFNSLYLFIIYIFLAFLLIFISWIVWRPLRYSKLSVLGFGLSLLIFSWFTMNFGYPVLIALSEQNSYLLGMPPDSLTSVAMSLQNGITYFMAALLFFSIPLNIVALVRIIRNVELKGKLFSILGVIFSALSLLVILLRVSIGF